MIETKQRVEGIESVQGKEQISCIKKDLDELEWQNRKLNLEFHGLPKTDKKDLLAKVNEIAGTLEVPELTHNDVTAAHRLPSKPDKTPAVIVRFARQATRNAWFEARKKHRETESDVYIQANMTKQTRTLLWETKQWAQERNFRFVWHNNGKVLIRRNEGDRAIVVRSKHDLEIMT